MTTTDKRGYRGRKPLAPTEIEVKIARFLCDSAVIKAIEYVEVTKVLIVTFNSGKRYMYYNVPKQVFAGFKRTPSVGGYFHKRVKDFYKFTPMGADK